MALGSSGFVSKPLGRDLVIAHQLSNQDLGKLSFNLSKTALDVLPGTRGPPKPKGKFYQRLEKPHTVAPAERKLEAQDGEREKWARGM